MNLILVVAALVIALVHEAQNEGRELLGWAVVLLALGLAWTYVQGLLG